MKNIFLKHPICIKFQVGLESNRVFQKCFFQPFLMFKKRNLVSVQFPTHISLLFFPTTVKSGVFLVLSVPKVFTSQVLSVSQKYLVLWF